MLTRFMAVSYWNPQKVWFHLLALVLKHIPPPENGICFVIADIVPFTGMPPMRQNGVNSIPSPEKARNQNMIPGSLGCIFWSFLCTGTIGAFP